MRSNKRTTCGCSRLFHSFRVIEYLHFSYLSFFYSLHRKLMDSNTILWILGAWSRCFRTSRIWMVWPRQSGIPGCEIRGLDLSECTLCKACAQAEKLGYKHVIMHKCEPEARSLTPEVSQSVLLLYSVSAWHVATFVKTWQHWCALCTGQSWEQFWIRN